jgi:hypothetical protein
MTMLYRKDLHVFLVFARKNKKNYFSLQQKFNKI